MLRLTTFPRFLRIPSRRPSPGRPFGRLRFGVGAVLVLAITASAASTARADAPASKADAEAATPSTASPKRGPWEVMQKKEGIVAQRREVEGSPLHEFQGTGVVDAPISLVFAVIRDADRRTEWMSDCVGSHLIDEEPSTNQISYNRTQAPWPVADRDVVIQGGVHIDVKKREVFLPFTELDHPKQPPVPGVVRMPFLRGHWRLVPQGENATLVEYRVHANPGGALPGFVVNWVSQKLPFVTLKNLREQVKKDPYTGVVRRFEARPEYAALVGRADAPAKEKAAAIEEKEAKASDAADSDAESAAPSDPTAPAPTETAGTPVVENSGD